MNTLRDKVATERRRLKSVREVLSAGVAAKAAGDASFVPFYIAVGHYMEASMHRLHVQDVKMGDMIRDKVESVDDKVGQALAELDERLEGNQRHLAEFSAACAALESEGTSALARFEQAGGAYSQYITTNMGHHGATTELAQRLFSSADWEYMANINEADMQREQELYREVFDALPARLSHLRPAV
jgi:hypothetical protein